MADLTSGYIRDIWELDGVPAFREFWTYGLFLWKHLYRGFYSPWHIVPAPSVSNPKGTRELYRMGVAKLISAQLAKYVWGEQCEVNVSQEGSEILAEYVAQVLVANNFYTKLGELYEQCAALGGGVIKVYAEVPKDESGNDAGEPVICLSYHMADQFVPTAWDNADITEGIFLSREAKDGYYYTRVEWHKWDGNTYVIENRVFREDSSTINRIAAQAATEPQTILGYNYPLDRIYPLLSPSTSISGLEQSLFSYIRPAGANNIDDNSPLGVSIYANAMGQLRACDIAYDSFVREGELCRPRIIVPARAVRPFVNEQGRLVRYFDTTDSVYEAFSFDDTEDLKIIDNTCTLHTGERLEAINGALSLLAGAIGFDAGVLSFDKDAGMKTATEVVSERSKTYTTIHAHQDILKAAIEKTVHNIIDLASVYGVSYNGQSIAALAVRGYEVNIHFDDSIISDKQKEMADALLEVGNGVMSKMTYLQDIKGYTEEQARAELQRIGEEGLISPVAVDKLDAFND